MRLRHIVVLLWLGICVTLSGCSGEELAEDEIEEAAPRYIGPADRYEADVEGLTASRAKRVQLVGYDVRTTPDIELRVLELSLTDLTYQRNPFRITSIEDARFAVLATDAAVTTYLNSQVEQRSDLVSLRAVQVTFLRDLVRITGTAVVDDREVPITTTGKLRPQGAQVLYQPQTITVGDLAMGEQLRAVITRVINPLVDLSGLTFEPVIETITMRPGTIAVSGSANTERLVEMR